MPVSDKRVLVYSLGAISLFFLLFLIYWFVVRDTWEADNFSSIVEMCEQVSSARVNGNREQYFAASDRLRDFIGSRSLENEDLKALIARANLAPSKASSLPPVPQSNGDSGRTHNGSDSGSGGVECWHIGLALLAGGIVKILLDPIGKTKQTPEDKARETWGEKNPAMVCPHCQKSNCVRTKFVSRKKGISGGKATGAILTGGISLLATGLSRSEYDTQAHCDSCRNTWYF